MVKLGVAAARVLRISRMMLALSIVMASSRALADPGDSIRLSSDGVMNSGRTIYIDLVNGHLFSTLSDRGYFSKGFTPKISGRTGTLTPQALEALKLAVRSALAKGLETPSCVAEDEAARAQHLNPPPPPPTADSNESMSIAIDGRFVDVPRQGCWSPALGDLWGTITKAADHDQLLPLVGDF